VKSGLERLKPYFETFRTTISFLNSSNQRIAAYKSYCVTMRVHTHKFVMDMDVRWNTTSLMPYKSTFPVFITTHYLQTIALHTDNHCHVGEGILEIIYLVC
jgi:hypothetical protein